jgi:hypothetical protein
MSFANWKGALLDMDLAAHGTAELEKVLPRTFDRHQSIQTLELKLVAQF